MLRAFSYLLWAVPLAFVLTTSSCSRSELSGKTHEEMVAEGHKLYERNDCGKCHGPKGHGDGPTTKTVHFSPRDFRDASAFVNGYSVDRIARTIGTGVGSGDQSMPSYSSLSKDDRKLLAVFVMSLREDSESVKEKAE